MYRRSIAGRYVKNQNIDTGSKLATQEMSFLHDLRLYGAHGDEKLAKAFQTRACALPAPQVRGRVTEGAKQIASLVEQPTLETVVAVLLKMGAETE